MKVDPITTAANSGRPFTELRETGLLWLINRAVLHPRGYALALHFEGRHPDLGPATGWSLLGDGTQPWSFNDPTPEEQERGAMTEDEVFRRVTELLTPKPQPACTSCRDTGTVHVSNGDDEWDHLDCPDCPPEVRLED